MSYSQEVIPNSNNVFRNVSVGQVNNWAKGKRRPNPADFVLKEEEEGLSVNWDKYFNINDIFVNIGLKKTKKDQTKYLDPKAFRVIKFNVGDLRNIELITNNHVNVIYKLFFEPPLCNRPHTEICYDISV